MISCLSVLFSYVVWLLDVSSMGHWSIWRTKARMILNYMKYFQMWN